MNTHITKAVDLMTKALDGQQPEDLDEETVAGLFSLCGMLLFDREDPLGTLRAIKDDTMFGDIIMGQQQFDAEDHPREATGRFTSGDAARHEAGQVIYDDIDPRDIPVGEEPLPDDHPMPEDPEFPDPPETYGLDFEDFDTEDEEYFIEPDEYDQPVYEGPYSIHDIIREPDF